MKRSSELMAVLAAVLLFGLTTSTPAQTLPHERVAQPTMPTHPVSSAPAAPVSTPTRGAGTIIRPQSSIEVPGNAGVRAHTNLEVFLPTAGRPGPDELPPFSGYAFETPASIACVYSLVAPVAGCNPNTVMQNPSGGSHVIAVVDAYDDPWAAPDLAYFSAQFGIPFTPEQFQVIYAYGSEPPEDPTGGWELEESVDIEVAHAMAPNATIYLVEAESNSLTDLVAAVQVASNLVQCQNTTPPYTCSGTPTGVGEVIMSWGGSEFSTETSYDSYFTSSGVVYFAASGDSPGVEYPCASPNVVCVGGTAIARNSYGSFVQEYTWPDDGNGVSAYETPLPGYQSIGNVENYSTTNRVVPDVSADSDPDTGIWIWDSYEFQFFGGSPMTGWYVVGGTSVGNVIWAGIVNRAGGFAASSNAELTTLYTNRFSGAFNDITYGFCGPYAGFLPTAGWDICTGIGSPKGYSNK